MVIKKKPEKVIADFVKDGAQRITDAHITYAIDKADKIKYKFSHEAIFLRFKDDVDFLISLVEDYCSEEYKEVSDFTIKAIVFTLLYVLEPLDRLPDAIPVVGYTDDYSIVLKCLKLI